MRKSDFDAMLNDFDSWGATEPVTRAKTVGAGAGLAVAAGVAVMPTVGLLGCFLYTCWNVATKAEEASLNRFAGKDLRDKDVGVNSETT